MNIGRTQLRKHNAVEREIFGDEPATIRKPIKIVYPESNNQQGAISFKTKSKPTLSDKLKQKIEFEFSLTGENKKNQYRDNLLQMFSGK